MISCLDTLFIMLSLRSQQERSSKFLDFIIQHLYIEINVYRTSVLFYLGTLGIAIIRKACSNIYGVGSDQDCGVPDWQAHK